MSNYGFNEARRKLDIAKYSTKLSEAVGEPVILQPTCKSNEDIYVEVKDEKGYVRSNFRMIEFPGCCAFCVSTGTWVDPRWRGKKVAYILQEIKEDLARIGGYAGIFATIVKGNPAQERVLPKSGFSLVGEATGLKNPKTTNEICTYFKGLC